MSIGCRVGMYPRPTVNAEYSKLTNKLPSCILTIIVLYCMLEYYDKKRYLLWIIRHWPNSFFPM